jgi:hypothetical protein
MYRAGIVKENGSLRALRQRRTVNEDHRIRGHDITSAGVGGACWRNIHTRAMPGGNGGAAADEAVQAGGAAQPASMRRLRPNRIGVERRYARRLFSSYQRRRGDRRNFHFGPGG